MSKLYEDENLKNDSFVSSDNKKTRNQNSSINNKKSHKRIEKEKKHHLLTFKRLLIIIFTITIISAITIGIKIVKWQNLAKNMINNSPSIVYDTDNNEIAKFGSNKNISNLSLDKIPNNLKNAYIAIEDQRFYKHHGVDFPRTTAAILSYITNVGKSSFGGSSITQQLVKNLTGDNSSKVTRKVNEWIRAVGLEGILNKDEILESYLNIIYVGPNIYGVDLGSKYYFNKDVSNLSLEECAFLAGINNSPNSYNPFGEKDTSEKIKTRTKAVLSKMLELKYIDQESFDKAIANVDKGLHFKQGKIEQEKNNNINSYHTDALLSQLINDISKRKHISKEFAENYIYMSGLKIYSTQNSKIQKSIEDELAKGKYRLPSANDRKTTSQAAMVIIDHKTGQVLGCVGGIGKKSTARGFNRATQALRQTGSASKPLAVLVPGIDLKLFTASSMYLDEEKTFDDGTEEGYSPTDYNKPRGNITVRQAVESSQNIPFVSMMEQINPKTSIKYMKKMGISSLTKVDDNLNLALGGLDKGISPLEMAAAYASIANNGVYIEPTFYTKITNSNDRTFLKTKQNKHKAMPRQVAFIIQNLLTEPVKGSHGTAKYCSIPNIDVAAKTGTTNNEYDRWLCGFTPYYTGVTWFGFDMNETIKFSGKNPSGQIWSTVMKQIHHGLKRATFEVPNYGIERASICPTTGDLAFAECPGVYTEYFLKGTLPTNYCVKHGSNNTKPSKPITPPKEETKPSTPQENTKPEQNTNNKPSEKPKETINNSIKPNENSSNTITSNSTNIVPSTNTVTQEDNTKPSNKVPESNVEPEIDPDEHVDSNDENFEQ